MSLTIGIKGIREMKREMSKLSRQLTRNKESAVKSECTDILAASRDKFVPVDDGTLRDDSGVEVETNNATGETTGTIWYGKGEARDYAVAVHENTSKYDPPTWKGKPITFKPDGRGPKYLERPLRDAEQGFVERVRDKVFKGVGGGG